jgi:hypothetical protein
MTGFASFQVLESMYTTALPPPLPPVSPPGPPPRPELPGVL